MPPRSPVRGMAPASPTRALYAVRASSSGVIAWLETNSAPVKIAGGKPVMDVPVVPMSPLMAVGPVFVVPWELRTAKVDAEPRVTWTCQCLKYIWTVSIQLQRQRRYMISDTEETSLRSRPREISGLENGGETKAKIAFRSRVEDKTEEQWGYQGVL